MRYMNVLPIPFPLPPTPLDVDECRTGAHGCDAANRCINIEGSYTCGCTGGFRPASGGRACIGEQHMRMDSTAVSTASVGKGTIHRGRGCIG